MEPLPELACEYCTFGVPINSDHCPHCARPSRFPNVLMAEQPQQSDALNARFEAATGRLSHESRLIAAAFRQAVDAESRAVIARPSADVFRLLSSDRQLYASFYQLLDAATRLPANDSWDQHREVVDSRLFPHFKYKIRFAALSLSGRGLATYGDCFLILRDDMIGHRSTVFEENSVVFCTRNEIKCVEPVPPGYRATWAERGKLAVAKHGHEIDETLSAAGFPALILASAENPADDRFIEVHIFGSISSKSVESVSIDGRRSSAKRSPIRLRAMRERLCALGIPFEERQSA